MTQVLETRSSRRRRALRLLGAGFAVAVLAVALPVGVPAAPAAPAAPAPNPAQAPTAAQQPSPDAIASLAWLEGTWFGQDGPLTMEEVWLAPRGGALLGIHRDVKGDRMVEFEFLRIVVSDGAATLWASPRSAPPTPFHLKELGPGRRVVFENLQHDFPQRILYWRTDDDALHARIEGPSDTGEKEMEWTFKRGAPAAR